MSENERMLALVERGEAESAEVIASLFRKWAVEDEVTAALRHLTLEAHQRGARDRDAARVRYGGVSIVAPADPAPVALVSADPPSPPAEVTEPPMEVPTPATTATDAEG